MPARLTQSPLEVLLEADVSSRVTQSVLEVALNDSDRTARVSQIVLEVLHKWTVAPVSSGAKQNLIFRDGRIISL